ncbi:hypothetical protein SAMN05421837_102460 [Amycolatopsis pretoriensis]|uniref:Uncharacterized protein n=1 Tax=Amycolatopsis pretoriensis TaxID=218821 RepID=A0A1H5QD00_9PSEU|nr:hypothetical protein [Amycolatopsis pretoriensis]SEF23879.1 hypothetical protein SAMN05421837_102460 [Amycolatopsis pretoriensis]
MESVKDAALVRPGFRERVDAVMRDRWREPVIVLRLGDTDLRFAVPGRRPDGSVEGEGKVRQGFLTVARGIGAAVGFVAYLASAAGSGGGKGERAIHVTGPADAQALEPIDRLRRAKGPWLVCSPTSVAFVDTGSTYLDPADAPDPAVVWEARGSTAPEVSFRKRTLTWADGSRFEFPLQSRTEDRHLRQFHSYPDEVRWPE